MCLCPKVVATVSSGVENLVYISASTPADVVSYLVDLPNGFVTYGSTTSCIERYQKIDKIAKAWQEDCVKSKRRARANKKEVEDDATTASESSAEDAEKEKPLKITYKQYEKDYKDFLARCFPNAFPSFRAYRIESVAWRGFNKAGMFVKSIAG